MLLLEEYVLDDLDESRLAKVGRHSWGQVQRVLFAYHKATGGSQNHAVESENSACFAFVICIYAWQ